MTFGLFENKDIINDEKDYMYYRRCINFLVDILCEERLVDLVCRFAEGDTEYCIGSDCKYIKPDILRSSINKNILFFNF